MANFITIFRFILILVFALLFLTSNDIAALFVFAIAALSDWLDGYVARRTKITEFGKIADPVADRLLIIVTIVLLAVREFIPLLIMFVIVGRDIIVAAVACIMEINGIRMEVLKIGKYASAAVMGSIVLTLLNIPYNLILLCIATALYVAVAGFYIHSAVVLYMNRRKA